MFPTYLPRVTASGQVGGINVWHEPTGEEMAGNQVLVPGVNEVINILPRNPAISY